MAGSRLVRHRRCLPRPISDTAYLTAPAQILVSRSRSSSGSPMGCLHLGALIDCIGDDDCDSGSNSETTKRLLSSQQALYQTLPCRSGKWPGDQCLHVEQCGTRSRLFGHKPARTDSFLRLNSSTFSTIECTTSWCAQSLANKILALPLH